jgi:hypothetical protein
MRAMKAHLWEPRQIFEPQLNDRLRCPKCATPAHLTRTILDTARGNTVRLFHCAGCGRLWDDGSQYAISRPERSERAGDAPPASGAPSDRAEALRSAAPPRAGGKNSSQST